MSAQKAILALENGSVFVGRGFGASATRVGEAVFNTSLSGYQEILTDPSYHGQIVVMTMTQIGNYGTNAEDPESAQPHVSGFAAREVSRITSNWRSTKTLSDYLNESGIPGIEGIDTRAITKQLRVAGAMRACLTTEAMTPAEAVARAQAWEGLVGVDFVRAVSTRQPYRWDSKDNSPFTVAGTCLNPKPPVSRRFPIVAIDLGAKRNIFRKLTHYGFDVTVVPADAPYELIREFNPAGIFLSNGPGDPAAVPYVHATTAKLIQHYPTFGICMGNQMLTHALGAKTFKLKFGHRGGNQPVKNLETGRVTITSQNHGFAARKEDVEQRGAVVTEVNLNDGTVEGLRHKELPAFSVQYHPEAAPGPHDAEFLFQEFYDMVARHA